MKCSNLLAGAAVVLLASTASADDQEEIRKLIPAATAMRQADFEALAKSPVAPREADVAEKSLSLKLFAMRVQPDQKPVADFHFLSDATPKPSDVAREIYRTTGLGSFKVLTSPVTFIHAERITDFTCDVDGDKATGVVAFLVPKLYEGKVGYSAHRKDGTWQITELTMPGHGIHLVRGEAEKWVDHR